MSTTTKATTTTKQGKPVITQLEEQLAAAEAEAAPVLAKVREYEDEILVLKHELGPKHDLSPEEWMVKEKELAERQHSW